MKRDLWLNLNLFVPIVAGAIIWGQAAWYARLRGTGHSVAMFLDAAYLVAAVATFISMTFAIYDIREESRARGIAAIVLTILLWMSIGFIARRLAFGLI